ncbi:hypothetical protein EP232_04805 [bacterium]|nr:MAG: hypothetical protein EP232_04805 [bacterium]
MVSDDRVKIKNTGDGELDQKPSMSGPLGVLWKVATSPVTFVVLTILWCVDLGAGSIAAYFNDPQFWIKMDSYPFNLWLEQVAPRVFPLSLWIYILVGLSYLMIISLLLCTINWFLRRRKKLKGLGEVLVHLGFLLIFTGFVLGSALGSRQQVRIPQGESADVPGMGISLELEELVVVRSPEGRPLDTISSIRVFKGVSEVSEGKVRTNHPLIWGKTVIYPPEDYTAGVVGGVLGVSAAGAVRLVSGQSVFIGKNRVLEIGGILQRGERRGNVQGPGLLIVMKDPGGRFLGSAYLSPAPGMNDRANIAGTGLTLGQLTESTYGLYRVHRDPGVWLVIIGSVILFLGTFWALAGYLGIVPGATKPQE